MLRPAVAQAAAQAGAQALAQAGTAARGATAYVSLEPCAHHGQTPPCAEALIGAGVARVVAPFEDTDPRVAGQGFAMLRAAGIAVTTGVCVPEADRDLAGFFLRVEQGRPWVTLKMAGSLDGRIATATGQSQWITGPEARRHVHGLRARHDAVLVGAGTARMAGIAFMQPPSRTTAQASPRSGADFCGIISTSFNGSAFAIPLQSPCQSAAHTNHTETECGRTKEHRIRAADGMTIAVLSVRDDAHTFAMQA